MSDIFVSYSREDVAFARALVDSLRSREVDVWIDEAGITPTAEWLGEIFAAIEGADHFVIVLTAAWCASETCRIEMTHAVDNGKRVVPFMLEDPVAAEVPEPVARLQWARCAPRDDADRAAAAIYAAAQVDLDQVHLHTRLLNQAIHWRNHGRDRSGLLRGRELATAQAWLSAAPGDPAPTELQRAFVDASRLDVRRRRRWLVLVGLVALAAATVFGLRYLDELERSALRERIAFSRQLASQALKELDASHDLPLLLGLEAYRVHPTFESIDALQRALLRRPNLLMVLPVAGERSSGIAFAGDAHRLVVGGEDGSLQAWDLNLGSFEAAGEGLGRAVDRVAMDPERQRRLVTASDGDLVSVHRSDAGVEDAQSIVTGDYEVLEVAYSPDGRHFATANGMRGSGASLWDAAERRELRRFSPPDEFGVDAVAFSPDGTTLAVSGWDSRIALFDVSTARLVRTVDTGTGYLVDSLAFDPTGRRLAYVHHDAVTVVDLDDEGGAPWVAEGAEGDARSVAFSPDGRWLAAGFDQGRVRVWDLPSGGPPRTHRDLTGYVEFLTFSPDSKRLAAAGYGRQVAVWDLTLVERFGRLVGLHGARVTALAVSPDGSRVATGGWDKTVRLWDPIGGAALSELRGHQADVYGLAFFAGGQELVSTGSPAGALIFEALEVIRWDLAG